MCSLIRSTVYLIAILWSVPAFALTFPLPEEGGSVVGQISDTLSQPGENLSDIAVRTGFGYYQLVEANPSLSRTKPLAPNTSVILPGQFVLPMAPREGIVINLAELRVYYYPPDSNTVMTFPIAIGKVGWRTPLAKAEIVEKVKNPAWRVPDNIMAEALRQGVHLPAIVPPGPKNPLGHYALHLSLTGIMLHGTTSPHSIGMRGSHGCMRMYPDDIESLFNAVSVGTPVVILNQPSKVGWLGDQIYLETHVPLRDYVNQSLDIATTAAALIGDKAASLHIDTTAAETITAEENGMPQVIGQF